MFKTFSSKTNNLTLDQVVKILKENSNVDGVLIAGSGGSNELQENSDYDLIIIVKEMPENILTIITYIDNRFTDVFFFTTCEIDELLTKEKVDADSKEGWVVRWINGTIKFDKSGRLNKLKIKSKEILQEVKDSLVYQFWFKINYNLVQNIRYLKSRDETYLQALDVRLLYSTSEAFIGYFNLRKIVWSGEKNAVKYLRENDPKFLELFQKCVSEGKRTKKFELYKELALFSLSAFSNTWENNASVVMPKDNFSDKTIVDAENFWEKLLKIPKV